MKKVLAGELLSIAHRILQIKDKEDVSKLYFQAKDLYEKLAVLKFYYDNQEVLKDSMSLEILEKQLRLATDEISKNKMLDAAYTLETDSRANLNTSIDNNTANPEDSVELSSSKPADLIIENADKIKEEITAIDFEKKEVNYETQFLDVEFDDSIEENEEDQLIHQYLDLHETMLKQEGKEILKEEKVQNEDETSISNKKKEEDSCINPYSGSLEAMGNDEETKIIKKEELQSGEELLISEEEIKGDNPEQIPQVLTTTATDEASSIEIDEVIQEVFINPESGIAENANVKFEDSFLGFDFGEVDFIRVKRSEENGDENLDKVLESAKGTPLKIEKEEQLSIPNLFDFEEASKKEKKKSVNDIYNKTITVDLNDKIGFEKHLFNGDSQDLNRVLSQLNTLDSWEEALTFIDELVKPDYDNWEGKEEFEMRFKELVKKRFV